MCRRLCGKGEKAGCIGGGYKLWYYGSENNKDGVGTVLRKDKVDRVVVEAWISDMAYA